MHRLSDPYLTWGIFVKQGEHFRGATDLDWHQDWAPPQSSDSKATRTVLSYAIKLTYGASNLSLPHADVAYTQAIGSALCFHARTWHRVCVGGDVEKLVLHIGCASVGVDGDAVAMLPTALMAASTATSMATSMAASSSHRQSTDGRLVRRSFGEGGEGGEEGGEGGEGPGGIYQPPAPPRTEEAVRAVAAAQTACVALSQLQEERVAAAARLNAGGIGHGGAPIASGVSSGGSTSASLVAAMACCSSVAAQSSNASWRQRAPPFYRYVPHSEDEVGGEARAPPHSEDEVGGEDDNGGFDDGNDSFDGADGAAGSGVLSDGGASAEYNAAVMEEQVVPLHGGRPAMQPPTCSAVPPPAYPSALVTHHSALVTPAPSLAALAVAQPVVDTGTSALVGSASILDARNNSMAIASKSSQRMTYTGNWRAVRFLPHETSVQSTFHPVQVGNIGHQLHAEDDMVDDPACGAGVVSQAAAASCITESSILAEHAALEAMATQVASAVPTSSIVYANPVSAIPIPSVAIVPAIPMVSTSLALLPSDSLPSPAKGANAAGKRRRIQRAVQTAAALQTVTARISAPPITYGALFDNHEAARLMIDAEAAPARMVQPTKDTTNKTTRTYVCSSVVTAWQRLSVEERNAQPIHQYLGRLVHTEGGSPSICCGLVQIKKTEYYNLISGYNLNRDSYSKVFFGPGTTQKRPIFAPGQPPPRDLRCSYPSNSDGDVWACTLIIPHTAACKSQGNPGAL